MAIVFSCKNCVPPKRHLGCHSTCEEYIKQKAEHDEARKKNQNYNQSITLNSNGTFYSGKWNHRKY